MNVLNFSVGLLAGAGHSTLTRGHRSTYMPIRFAGLRPRDLLMRVTRYRLAWGSSGQASTASVPVVGDWRSTL
jgi:hypothetical protein